MRYSHLILAIVVTLVANSISLSTYAQKAARQDASSSRERQITVGGVRGLSSLADPDASAMLRKSNRVGLYLHAEGWKVLDENTQKRILEVFQNAGYPVVELGFNANAQGYFKNFYRPTFADKGVHSRVALVNGLGKAQIEQAHGYIDAARENGFKSIAPVFAPNSGQYKTSTFADSRWDSLREIASYGGALAVDAPPHVFIALGKDYQQFVIDEICWARKERIPVTLIISGNASKQSLFEESRAMLDVLRRNSATPNDYVLEAYDPNFSDAANTVGGESENGTVMSTALKLLQHHWLGN